MHICLVEDDAIMAESLVDRFQLEGLEVDWCQRVAEARERLHTRQYGVVVCDIRLPDGRGDRLYESLRREQAPIPPFLFVTGYADLDRAVELLKLGAADYMTKPFDLDQLLSRVRSLLPSAAANDPESAAVSLGPSPAMQRIAGLLPRLAVVRQSVLITGETGVGKDVVARRLHELGPDGPFQAVNCAALPEGLAESELFGHERGAFTGASQTHRGAFERAHGGTLLLDEVGDMPLALQAKLLRVLQEGSVRRVGGERSVPLDVRIVCATNQDLEARVAEGQFREDLYYRIHVVQLDIPPLRERPEDIVWLARRFLSECAQQHGTAPRRLHADAEQALLSRDWPGNARELRHCLERACIFAEGAWLHGNDVAPGSLGPGPAPTQRQRSLQEFLADCERQYIRDMLRRHEGRIGTTADALGITRKALWQKMKRLQVRSEDTPER